MHTRLLRWLFLLSLAPLLGGCFLAVAGGAAAGVSAAHDRRGVGTWADDKRIYLSAYDSLNKDKELALKNSVIIVVYNGTMLLVGEVRTPELKARAERLVGGFEGTRRIVNELDVREPEGFWSRRRDNTITAHVKTALLDLTSLRGFDPTRVNVTTAHRTVYLMGKVTNEESDAVVGIARDVSGVERVVKVFEYVEARGKDEG
ncbi:BON domain-containing protein [Dokdonella sp.]|uniref:BON domain-containing protein n=1 Tax=Dokdonella sp. TaxID=2291710 RepID=UPI001B088E61|nr:BON domain-containing protein [Dokdonella sp.]MBO9665079.1 BON domain-containing protein [Dokdonella sp.]